MLTEIDGIRILKDLSGTSYQAGYQESLYHQHQYLQAQTNNPEFSFYLCSPKTEKIVAKIHFDRREQRAISQWHAPFGSLDGDPGTPTTAALLLNTVINTLKSNGFDHIEIHHPANCYRPSEVWEQQLVGAGFSVRSMLNHHLAVDDRAFNHKIHLMERRKLTKCKDFKFNICGEDSLPDIYYFIEACRKERNQCLSLSFDELQPVVNKLTHHFLLVSVSYREQLAAAAIIIKVNSRCWYQFYPAHSRQFDRESPIVFLLSNLYQYARASGVSVIDLGTSEVAGRSLPGLIEFKNRLGSVVTEKKIFSKPL